MGKYIEMLLYMQDDTQWCEAESREQIEKNMDIFEKSKMARRKRRGLMMANYMEKILFDDEEYQPKEFSKDDIIHDIMLERERVFFLGFRKKFPGVPDIFQHQLHDRQQKIKDIKELKPKFNIPDYIKNRIDGKYRDLPSIKTDNDIGNTCVAHYAKDRSTTLIFDDNGYKGLRPFTPREYARLQGIPEEYVFSSTSMTTKYKMIGNSVSPVICRAIALEVKKYFEEVGQVYDGRY